MCVLEFRRRFQSAMAFNDNTFWFFRLAIGCLICSGYLDTFLRAFCQVLRGTVSPYGLSVDISRRRESRLIKRSIKASNADLLVVFQRVDGMLRAQFVQLEQAMQKDKTSVYHRHKQTWGLPCKHQIRLVISSMWKGETWA
jgi:hypothetical protein